MVGTPTAHSACWRFIRRGSSTQGNMYRNLTSLLVPEMRCKQPGSWRKGLNDENSLAPPSQGKNFLLTFPFIEPVRRKVLNAENLPPLRLRKKHSLDIPFYRTRSD
jgi:hypothetical protein